MIIVNGFGTVEKTRQFHEVNSDEIESIIRTGAGSIGMCQCPKCEDWHKRDKLYRLRGQMVCERCYSIYKI